MNDYAKDNDLLIIDHFREGSEQALNVIYDRYSKQLFYFARRFVDHTAEAEDITAEAFLKLWNKKEEFETLDAIVMFLHTVVKNRCFDYIKHVAVKTNHQTELIRVIESAEIFNVGEELMRMELMSKIYHEVEKMPEKMREIFYLSYKEGLKPLQIAERLNISVQTVKNQKLNAIKLLKKAFKDHPYLLAILTLMQLELLSINA